MPNGIASQTNAQLNLLPWSDGGLLAMQHARYEASSRIGPFRPLLLDAVA